MDTILVPLARWSLGEQNEILEMHCRNMAPPGVNVLLVRCKFYLYIKENEHKHLIVNISNRIVTALHVDL